MTALYDAAMTYIDAGWSPIPLRGKVPVTKGWADGSPTSKADAYGWWVEEGFDGIGIACGAVSGGLVVIDIEGRLVADSARMQRVMQHAAATGVDHIVSAAAATAAASTPSGGLHLFLAITDADVPGNTKLAYARTGPAVTDHVLLVETRGQGGQVAAPPGPGRGWLNASGPGSAIPVTFDEYARVIACFRQLDESTRLTAPPRPAKPAQRIGGVFDTTYDGPTVAAAFADALLEGEITWADLLDPGWTLTGYDREGRSLWLRPEYGGVKSTALSSAHGYERYADGPSPVLVNHSASVPHLPQGDGQRITPARAWALSWFDDEATAYRTLEDCLRDGVISEPVERLPAALLTRLFPIIAAKTPNPDAPLDDVVAPVVPESDAGEVDAGSRARLNEGTAGVASSTSPASPHRTGIDLTILPPVMRDVVQTVADNTQTDPAIGALLAIAAISAATAGGFRFGGAGWTETSAVWAVVAADPSERKSAVLDRIAMRPLLDAQKFVRDDLAGQLVEHRASGAVLEAELATAKDAAKRASDDTRASAARIVSELEQQIREHAEAKPIEPAYVLSEGTPEAVIDVMANNAGVCSVVSAEGMFLQIVAGGYSERAKPSPAALALNAAWSSEPVISVRRGHPRVEIPRTFLTVGLAVQPDVIDVLASQALRGTGFTARWLLCVVPKRRTPMTVTAPPLDDHALTAWENLLGAVMFRGWTGAVGSPHRLDLSPEALRVYQEWLDTAYRRTVSVDDDLTAWWGKAHGQALRVAGLFQLAQDPGSYAIGADAVRYALRFIEWVAGRTGDLLGGRLSSLGDVSPEAVTKAHSSLLRWVEKKHGDGSWFRVRDVQSQRPFKEWPWPAGVKPSDGIREILADLVAVGHLEARTVQTSSVAHPLVGEYRFCGRPQSPNVHSRGAATPQVGATVDTVDASSLGKSRESISLSTDTSLPLSPSLSRNSVHSVHSVHSQTQDAEASETGEGPS